jgi:hypothetical protein
VGNLLRALPSDEEALSIFRSGHVSEFDFVKDHYGKELDALWRSFNNRLTELKVPAFSKKPGVLLWKFYNVKLRFPLLKDKRSLFFIYPIKDYLGVRSLKEICTIYKEQPIDQITSEGLKKIDKSSHAFLDTAFTPTKEIDIMLKEIALKFPLDKIESILQEYLNPDPTAHRFLAVKEKIRHKLTKKKEKLRAKLLDLQRVENQSFHRILDACPDSLIGDLKLPCDIYNKLKLAKEAGTLVGDLLTLFDNNYYTAFFAGVHQAPKLREDLRKTWADLKPEALEEATRVSMVINADLFQKIKDMRGK